jgi:hypothetical protein
MCIHQQKPSLSQSSISIASLQSPHRRRLVQSLVPLLLTLLVSASMWAQINPAPATFAGMMVSNGGSSTSPFAGDFPGVGSNAGLPFGVYRIWDTDATPSGYTNGYSLAWPAMQTSAQAGTTTLSGEGVAALKLELSNLYKANPNAVAMYTLSRTPWWALSTTNQSDTKCNYNNIPPGSWDGTGDGTEIAAPGQCDISSDLTTANGSGVYTNQNWRNWVTALADELNTLYLTTDTYAKVGYFEIWNEFDRSNSLTGESAGSNLSYQGNYAELLRMTEDARCILLGATAQPTIHNYNTSGGTEACNTTNFPGGVGLLSGVRITTPSAHAQGGTTKQIDQGIELMQNFLYCNVPLTDYFPPTSDCNWTESEDWGGNAVDVINFHMKPGNEAPPGGAANIQPEAEMTDEHNYAISALLTSHETGMPFMNGEAGYAGDGWNGSGCAGCIDLATSGPSGGPAPGEEAAFVARYALIQWALGFSGFNWYQYDGNSGTSSVLSTGTAGSLTLTDPGRAYYNVVNWIVGSSMSSGFNCGLVSGSSTGTLWSCQFTKSSPSGWKARVYWDVGAAYACLSADPTPCGTTYSLTVPTAFTYYQTAIGTTQTAISSHQINVSSMPTLVETATFTESAQ